MDEREFQRKYQNLKILKGIQEYLKSDAESEMAVYPIKVPQELLYQMVKMQGAESTDHIINQIFKMGLTFWSERLFEEVFRTPEQLKAFIDIVKERGKA